MSAASVRLDHDAHWVEVDLRAEPQAWAAATVSRRWTAQRLHDDPERAEVITTSIARIITSLDAAELAAALLLHPAADQPVETVVGLRSFPAPPGLTLHALGEELCMPEEMLEIPRDRSILQTPAGPAVRLVQRYREPLSPGVEEIREHLAYGWLVPGNEHENTVITLSTVFIDLVTASTSTNAVDKLAQSLTT